MRIIVLLLISIMAKSQVYVDKQGVLRDGKKEAAFFGVNYTTPFAHAYRAHKALGVDLEKAIRQDVYHLSRLGLDAFRVHVWDTEISDSIGNLLENDHLRLFDYLLAELKKRKIKTIITPIAFWGNGYPDPDEATPGFSRIYGKRRVTINDTAIRAQENYLKQFFKHVNPYTKLSYGNDPDVIAVEINNEPSHSGPKEGVTKYINRLVDAVKSTGFTKPLFYNISQNPYYADAVAASNVVGFSFQWYPTGLVAGHELKGNFLPNVDRYHIPFNIANKALMVYEFDAADLMQSTMYPAMARSYRQAGFQWATQFAYDPMAIANVNTEYQTHYVNLAYTPSKAISLMIASEVFHRVPRLQQFPGYPADSSFDGFRVSYKEQLSEMNRDGYFYYSNSTNSKPGNDLRHIAGVGSSPVVKYNGSGAYFLDKIALGVWRLELMPDAVCVRDPFERTAPNREVTRIEWNTRTMQINLPDLQETLSIRPGTYVLGKKGTEVSMEFEAPVESPFFKGANFQQYIADKITASSTKLFIRARSTGVVKATVTLIDANAAAFSTDINLTNSFTDIEVPLHNLVADSAMLLPRPYPGFQPLRFKATAGGTFSLKEIEKIQVTIKEPYRLEIASIEVK